MATRKLSHCRICHPSIKECIRKDSKRDSRQRGQKVCNTLTKLHILRSSSSVPDKTKPGALISAWLSAQSRELLEAIIPRLCRMGFTFAQPFIVTDAITLAVEPNTQSYNNIGYGLIGAFAFVYGGMAVSISC